MSIDAVVLMLLAILDLALIAYLRRRHGRRVRRERMMASLRLAIRRENGLEDLPVRRPLPRASRFPSEPRVSASGIPF
jgi:hypothetical protein